MASTAAMHPPLPKQQFTHVRLSQTCSHLTVIPFLHLRLFIAKSDRFPDEDKPQP